MKNIGEKFSFQYLELRFHWVLRIEGTLLYMAQTLLYLGIVIYAPALALNAGEFYLFNAKNELLKKLVTCEYKITLNLFT